MRRDQVVIDEALAETEYTRTLRELVRLHGLPFLRGRAIESGESGSQRFFITHESLDQAIALWRYLPDSAYRAAQLRGAPDPRAAAGLPVDLDSEARLARPRPAPVSAHELEFLARFDGRPAVERGPGGPGESGCYWVTKDGAHVQVFAALPEACTFLGPDAFALCRRVGWTNKDLIEQLERREPIEHLEDASWEPTRPLLRENLLDVQ